MDTTLSSPTIAPREPVATSGSRPAAAISGAHLPLEEQVAVVNQHADAPTLTDKVGDGSQAPVPQSATEAGRALQNAVAASDEWLDAGRTAVRANPLLAIGGAALIGAALSIAISQTVRR